MRRSWRASVLLDRPEPDLRVWEYSTDHCWKQRHTTDTWATIRRYVHPAFRSPTMWPHSNRERASRGILTVSASSCTNRKDFPERLQSILYKIATQVNRKSQHSSLLISDWLRDYPQENIIPLYFMVKYAESWDFEFLNYIHEKAKIFKCSLSITSYLQIFVFFYRKKFLLLLHTIAPSVEITRG